MTTIKGDCHPACLLLPEIGEAEFAELVANIKEHGQRHAIIVDEAGLILDGRHRWRALRSLEVEPRMETFAGTEAEKVALVVSENITRRHLTTDQRAAIAAELSERLAEAAKERMTAGKAPAQDGARGKATEQAARMVGGVSARSVERAKARMREDPEAHEQAKAGRRPKAKPLDGDRRKSAASKAPKAEPARATGTYTVGSFTRRYTIPARADARLDLAWLRHAPAAGVAKWLRSALGAERCSELGAQLSVAV